MKSTFFSISYLFLGTRIPGQQSLFLNQNFTKINNENRLKNEQPNTILTEDFD